MKQTIIKLTVIICFLFILITYIHKKHHILPTHVTIDERGLYSVKFYYKGTEYALDYLTKSEYDSLENGTLSCLNK